MSLQHQFIEFALDTKVLRFGEFKTKAGRLSPYFFNLGLFNTGATLARLGEFYAKTLLQARERGLIEFDMIFGPAYKGIPLAAAVAVKLSEMGCDIPYAFNRKEAKDHGEGGMIIGAPLKGKVIVIDDVISAGTSVRESVKLIQAAGAQASGVLIALDRMEKGGNAEQMIDYKTGEPHTAHTTNPVPLMLVGMDNAKLKEGKLADLAPTMLEIIGLDKPEEMTGESIIVK